MKKIDFKTKDDVFETVTQKINKMIKKEKKGKERFNDEEFNELYRMLLDSADDPMQLRIANLMISLFMNMRVVSKICKMKKDERKGKCKYTFEEYDEVYNQMPEYIEYDDEKSDEDDADGYWDLNL